MQINLSEQSEIEVANFLAAWENLIKIVEDTRKRKPVYFDKRLSFSEQVYNKKELLAILHANKPAVEKLKNIQKYFMANPIPSSTNEENLIFFCIFMCIDRVLRQANNHKAAERLIFCLTSLIAEKNYLKIFDEFLGTVLREKLSESFLECYNFCLSIPEIYSNPVFFISVFRDGLDYFCDNFLLADRNSNPFELIISLLITLSILAFTYQMEHLDDPSISSRFPDPEKIFLQLQALIGHLVDHLESEKSPSKKISKWFRELPETFEPIPETVFSFDEEETKSPDTLSDASKIFFPQLANSERNSPELRCFSPLGEIRQLERLMKKNSDSSGSPPGISAENSSKRSLTSRPKS